MEKQRAERKEQFNFFVVARFSISWRNSAPFHHWPRNHHCPESWANQWPTAGHILCWAKGGWGHVLRILEPRKVVKWIQDADSSAGNCSSRLNFQILSTFAKYNSEVWITINSYYIYPQDEGHILSAFPTIKEVPGHECILFSAYFTNIPLAVSSRDMSTKFVSSLGGISTPNMISFSARRQIVTGPLHIRPSDSLSVPVKCSHTGAMRSVLHRAETPQSTLQKIKKNEANISLSYAHIYCSPQHGSPCNPLWWALRQSQRILIPSAA